MREKVTIPWHYEVVCHRSDPAYRDKRHCAICVHYEVSKGDIKGYCRECLDSPSLRPYFTRDDEFAKKYEALEEGE